MFLTTSKRNVRGALNHPASLQSKRGFFFFPFCYRYRRHDSSRALMPSWRWGKNKMKMSPEELIFMLKSNSGTSWGRRWEYESNNGVVKESTSDFVPGKGWVNTQEAMKYSSVEETDIDLITLRRKPRHITIETNEMEAQRRREEEIEEICELLGSENPSSPGNYLDRSDASIVQKGKKASASKNSSSKTTAPPKVVETKQEASSAGSTPPEDPGKKEPKVVSNKGKASKPETKASKAKTTDTLETTNIQTDNLPKSPEETLDAPRKARIPTSTSDEPVKFDEEAQDLPSQTKTSSTNVRVASKAKPADSAKEPKKSIPLQATAEPLENAVAPKATSSKTSDIEKAQEETSLAAPKSSEQRTVAKQSVSKPPPQRTKLSGDRAPGQAEENFFKSHRLNIGSTVKEELDPRDADIDLLVPSDVRIAAGAPGKTIIKPESEAEKEERRRMMAAEFDASKGRDDISEVPESPESVRDRMRLKAASLGLHPQDAANNLKQSATEPDTSKASVAPTHEKSEKEPTLEETHERDYEWSGTEDVSAEDVLKQPAPTKPVIQTPPVIVAQTTPEVKSPPAARPPPPPPTPPQNYYVLVRSPDSGSMHFASLPSTLISDTTRNNTAFDALRKLNSPDSFLPLWRILQKGGFTVVGGEKDCLIVKVDAEGSRAKQISVLKEIKLKLSPAETVARESWEKIRAGRAPEAPVREVLQGETKTVPHVVVPQVPTAETSQKVEQAVVEEQAPSVEKAKVKKSRPFRRIFWTAVWVAACSGAATVGLESYL